jgi:hypothetical protein
MDLPTRIYLNLIYEFDYFPVQGDRSIANTGASLPGEDLLQRRTCDTPALPRAAQTASLVGPLGVFHQELVDVEHQGPHREFGILLGRDSEPWHGCREEWHFDGSSWIRSSVRIF